MRRWLLGRRWAKLQKLAPDGPLRDYLSRGPVDPSADADSVGYIALDLETTGLDPRVDSIVALGWVLVERGRIRLETAESRLVSLDRSLPAESVTIHGLGDDRLATGCSLVDAISELLPLLDGRVVIAHHAVLDVGFLAAACRSVWQCDVVLPCIDTLAVLRDTTQRRQVALAPDALTLARARERFNLPRYPRHDALWDAIAAAELWLALRAELSPAGKLGLSRLVHYLP